MPTPPEFAPGRPPQGGYIWDHTGPDEAPSAAAAVGLGAVGHRLKPEHVPCEMVCPITLEVFVDPVVAADGHSYEREAIEVWLEDSPYSPATGEVLPDRKLIPNQLARRMLMRLAAELGRETRTAAQPRRAAQASAADAGAYAGVVVQVAGLLKGKRHNGKTATLLGYVPETERWQLLLAGGGGRGSGSGGGGGGRPQPERLSVRPENIELIRLPDGQQVSIHGLRKTAQHNGRWGTVVGVSGSRFVVELDGHIGAHAGGGGGARPTIIRVKPANLELVPVMPGL
eukprot:SAG22_NODE_209_length_15177_cov_9.282995_11_plen_285_part_00